MSYKDKKGYFLSGVVIVIAGGYMYVQLFLVSPAVEDRESLRYLSM